jgi:hypothetical protein
MFFSGFYMKPKQNTLTDAELLILLEGDVSDVDLDMSDDELDRNEHLVPLQVPWLQDWTG